MGAIQETRLAIDTPRGEVSGAWGAPRGAVATLVVAPGAGHGYEAPFLVGLCRGMRAEGIATLRFNFPYKERGGTAPDRAPVLRATWLAAFEAATVKSGDRPVFAGGKSMGGRYASMCAADGMPAAGLVFLGYPLHPPKDPTALRDEHLYGLRVPMLFLQGTRDPFARPEQLDAVLARLGKRAMFAPIEGGDHSFRVKGGTRDDDAIGAALVPLAATFIKEHL